MYVGLMDVSKLFDDLEQLARLGWTHCGQLETADLTAAVEAFEASSDFPLFEVGDDIDVSCVLRVSD